MSIKSRVQGLEAKAGSGYLIMEDLIRIIDLKKKKDRTPEEQRKLEELQAMEVEPKLHKVLLTLSENRKRRGGNILIDRRCEP
jgi:hypothetical protein